MYEVRLLTEQDQKAAWDLGSLAFGYQDHPMPAQWSSDTPGRVTWGVFDGERLVAKAIDRQQGQWFGGRVVPVSGIAGVAVAPEWRGAGLLRLVLTRLLAQARERGAVLSTLYGTTPFPYRRLGWAEVGDLTRIAMPTSALAHLRREAAVTLRPATEADFPAIQEIYRATARAGTGLMERSGPLFTASAADFLGSFNGVTVAIGQSVEGYASWNRGPGYDASGRVIVEELIGATARATTALANMFASWVSVAPTIVMRLPSADPLHYLISPELTKVEKRQAWSLRVVDAPAAVAARGWPKGLRATVDLRLSDEVCPWNEGDWRLVLADGEGKLEPGGDGAVQVTERGLALLYAGAATPELLRRAGFLSGGDAVSDELLRSATAGPAPELLDYF